jgi:uncharacterized membrane protein YraQ (UPF0718 family)
MLFQLERRGTLSTQQQAERRIPLPSQATAVIVVVTGLILSQQYLWRVLDGEALHAWSTVFVAIFVQALPFLVGGVVLAALISVLISERLLQKVVPRSPALAVPVAGIAGVALPGCECASVPIAGSLVRRGVAPAAALTFLLAAPAINPVVLVSTAVAFPGQPGIVLARFVASLATAVAVGWWWALRKGAVPLRESAPTPHASRASALLSSIQHDFLHTAGYLVLGAAIAATVGTFVPIAWMDSLAEQALVSVVILGTFAVIVAMCSEADAFVAASMTAFSDTAKLAFMVVGPAVDVKLAAMQAGQFGSGFALRFAPLTFVVALVMAGTTGWWLL